MALSMRSRTLERYLVRQIAAAVGFVLTGFLALFAFFDLIRELGDLGKGDYQLRQVATFVMLSVPAHAYELFPIAVLIGTLYVLSHLASNSEFTVMRAAGLSPLQAGASLAKFGLACAVATFAIGEWLAPLTEEAAQKLRMGAMSTVIAQDLRTGLWFKDERSFINVRQARVASRLGDLRIFEFDDAYKLRSVSAAREAHWGGNGEWRLVDVAQTRFTPEGPRTEREAERRWRSALTPELLDVLIVVPERMSAFRLYRYTQHLASNRQKTERYEIAMWKKLFYPVATLVMMALALPFGYIQARAGMVGLKVFLGIMLGIFFHMLNSLFSHIGLLQNWPPVAAAAVPSATFFLTALTMMWWVERR
ncbi:MAG TPA: LPS export ABC transporter permease LptG [Burkholderiales bacterium]